MIFGRFLAKSPPSTCWRLAGERMLDVAEIWRSLEALRAGDNGNFFFCSERGGGGVTFFLSLLLKKIVPHASSWY